MKLGDFEIDSFVEHKFWLDGGGMFGIVPKRIWNKLLPADENNLIPMVVNLFVLRAHGKVMMFDSGLGDTLTDREKKIYGTEGASTLEPGLRKLGLSVEDIDIVILSHLHTDHAAGAVGMTGGDFVPRFPKAKYIVARQEWNDALNPTERTRAAYNPERFLALEEAGQVDLIDPDVDLFPGIRAVRTGGHTGGHFGLQIESQGDKLWYYADIFPTSVHLPVAYVPAADLHPEETMDVRREALKTIIDERIIVAFDHDLNYPLGRVLQDGKKFRVEAVNG